MTAIFPTYPDLRGKVALITGIGQVGIPNSSTWGNGAATARILSFNGVKIFGRDLNLKAAEYTKKRILQDDANAQIDVTTTDGKKTDDVQQFVQAAMNKHGRVDILINNVGMTAKGRPWKHVGGSVVEADRPQLEQRVPHVQCYVANHGGAALQGNHQKSLHHRITVYWQASIMLRRKRQSYSLPRRRG